MNKQWFLGLSASLLVSTGTMANTHEVTVYLDSNSQTNIAPVLKIARDKWDQRPESDASFGFSQSRFGVAYRHTALANWQLHTMQRVDYLIETNAHTALGYYQEQNDQPLTSYDSYDTRLTLTGARSKGLGLAYQHHFDALTVTVQANYWQLNYLRDSQLSGALSGSDNAQLRGALQFSEFYSDNNFLKRPNTDNAWRTRGEGLSLDVHFDWQVTEHFALSGKVIDLYNQFEFDQAGFTEADINTKGSFVDNAGFSSFRPLLKGRETAQNHDFYLPRQVYLQGQYQYQDFRYLASVRRQGDQHFAQLGMQLGDWRMMLDPLNLAPELAYQGETWSVTTALDHINPNKALTLRLNFSWQLAW
ncbi:hypothetical protein [Pseudoalteromonas rubra]|uniref:Uncharacterized protein n=1 Tax=Pseudoalteromonas rubra TaxID=43658 RepID=A0A0U3GLB8_9GAMM|nr:hypothetical protein [Pseudoalteromonas rubra]ALU45690.1 hypothetical protein AT705_22390 [Pseudoalteromonas rubra]